MQTATEEGREVEVDEMTSEISVYSIFSYRLIFEFASVALKVSLKLIYLT